MEKLTLSQLQDAGHEIQEQFNSLTHNLEKNIKQRMLKLGIMEIVTNLPVDTNQEFSDILANISILGLDVMKLKVLQRNVRCKELILETEVDCLRILLSNMKQLRLNLYRKLDEQQKSFDIESNVKFDLNKANQDITVYVKKLYTLIAQKRTELSKLRESEVVELDLESLAVNDLLVDNNLAVETK